MAPSHLYAFPCPEIFHKVTFAGNSSGFLPLRALITQDQVHPDPRVVIPSHRLHLDRILRGKGTDHPTQCFEITWCSSVLRCTAGHNDFTMVRTILRSYLCYRDTRLASRLGWRDPYSYESRLCNWRSLGWWTACPESRKLLAVRVPLFEHIPC